MSSLTRPRANAIWEAPKPEPALGLSDAEHTHARLGVVYLFSKMELDLSWRSIAGELVTVGKAAKTVTGSVNTLTGSKPSITPSTGSKSSITDWVKGILEGTLNWVKDQFSTVREFGSQIATVVSMHIGSIKQRLGDWASSLLTTILGPLASEAKAIVTGLKDTVVAVIQATKHYYKARGIITMEGHPRIVVSSLRGVMNANIASGLLKVVEGALKATLTATTAGVSKIFEAICSIVSTIVQVIWRFYEICGINAFCTSAAEHWRNRDSGSAIHKDAAQFANWYGATALKFPGIAGWTLISGICGSKLHWLQLFDGQNLIQPEKFDQGVDMLDDLRSYAAKYLKEKKYPITSSDPMVSSLMSPDRWIPPESTKQKVWSMIKSVIS